MICNPIKSALKLLQKWKYESIFHPCKWTFTCWCTGCENAEKFFPILSRVQAKCENLALVLPSYRNQLIDLQSSSIDLFLYDRSTSKSSSLLWIWTKKNFVFEPELLYNNDTSLYQSIVNAFSANFSSNFNKFFVTVLGKIQKL